jgi:hypothetical protein
MPAQDPPLTVRWGVSLALAIRNPMISSRFIEAAVPLHTEGRVLLSQESQLPPRKIIVMFASWVGQNLPALLRPLRPVLARHLSMLLSSVPSLPTLFSKCRLATLQIAYAQSSFNTLWILLAILKPLYSLEMCEPYQSRAEQYIGFGKYQNAPPRRTHRVPALLAIRKLTQ